MKLNPNPIAHAQIQDIELVDGVRRLLCRVYERCLSHAAQAAWPGFTCAACNVRDDAPRDVVRLRIESSIDSRV